MADTQSPKEPTKAVDVAPDHQVQAVPSAVTETYFFPDLGVSVEAESLEAALEKLNKKG